MYWILAAAFALIALFFPRARPIGVAGLLLMALMLGWGMLQRARGGAAPDDEHAIRRHQPPSPAALQTVALDQVEAVELKLLGSGAPFELRGAIVNRSADMQLHSVTIRISRRDCYEGALDPSGCVVAWQDQHWLPLSLQPGERREFSSAIWMRGAAPRPRGQLRDEFALLAASGSRVQQAPAQ